MLHMYVSCFIYLCYLLWYIPVNRLIKILLINISAWEVEHLKLKHFNHYTKKKKKKKKELASWHLYDFVHQKLKNFLCFLSFEL